jgi:hypothetical protein
MHPRRTIGAARDLMDLADAFQQRGVGDTAAWRSQP